MRHAVARRGARGFIAAAAGCACAAGLAFAAGCASTGAPARGAAIDSTAAIADSLDRASLEDLFAARHAALAERIEGLESGSAIEPRVIEARSILSEAEGAYLMGRIALALELLDDVEEVLRRDS